MNAFIEVPKGEQTMYCFPECLWTREELKTLLAIDLTRVEDLNDTQKVLFAKAETAEIAFVSCGVIYVADSLLLEVLEG